MAFQLIVVPLAGTVVDPDVVRLAVTLGRPSKAQLLGVHVIEVRWNLPLDAHLEPELVQAREASAAIIDTARERGADLVLLGMPYRKRLGRTYVSRTVEEVYLGAPCAVLAYRQEEPR